jgi:hypothetical protein
LGKGGPLAWSARGLRRNRQPGRTDILIARLMKKPTREERRHQCTRKRRYRSPGDALDAARFAGVERGRQAYLCPLCQHWHLTSR